MLITKEVEVTLSSKYFRYYEDLGYDIPKELNKYGITKYILGTKITVKVEDLPKGSHAIIEVICDYCLKEDKITTIKKSYRSYNSSHDKYVIKNDCCAKCKPIKTKECNLLNYGVEDTFLLKEIQDKQKQTMIEKYGVDHNMKIKEVHNKAIQSWLDRPNEERQETLNKRNKTFEEKFGGHPMLLDEIKNKIINTNVKKYGVPYVMQNNEIMSKSRKTMYENNKVVCSRQQRYLSNLFGGILNYPISNCSVDIAFPEQKILIEYDGNGHDLCVKLGNNTYQEFKIKEIKRYQFLKSEGWKQIKIISPYDYLPSNEVLVQEFNKALEWFKSDDKGHWHYNINIGKKINDTTYGKLRRIKEEDLLKEIG